MCVCCVCVCVCMYLNVIEFIIKVSVELGKRPIISQSSIHTITTIIYKNIYMSCFSIFLIISLNNFPMFLFTQKSYISDLINQFLLKFKISLYKFLASYFYTFCVIFLLIWINLLIEWESKVEIIMWSIIAMILSYKNIKNKRN